MRTAPTDFDIEYLRDRVRATYERVALVPMSRFHFRLGLDYAVEALHYDRKELAALPKVATERFTGVGNPHRIAAIARGATVLDHACGAGTDLLLAARRVGLAGLAIGVDLTPGMCTCAASAAEAAGLSRIVEIREGAFEELPVESATIDYVISNGVVNLAPDKPRVFAEIVRVLKPGGELLLADVILSHELVPAARRNPDLWAACVAGALTEPQAFALIADAGLVDARSVERFDCFRNTSIEQMFAASLEIGGMTFYARKR